MLKLKKKPGYQIIRTEYQNLFDLISDGIVVANLDRTIRDINLAFTKMFGYDLDEIKGKSTGILYDNPEVFADIGKKIIESANDDKPFSYTLNYKKKNGEFFTGELHLFFVKDVNGKSTGTMGLIRDITERVKAEEKIRENSRQFNYLKNTSIDGFWLVDPEGKIIDVNEAYLKKTGYSREEMLNMHVRDFEVLESPELIKEHIKKIIKNGSDRFETVHRCKDGRNINIEASITFNYSNKNMLVFMHDITDRKKADAIIHQKAEDLLKANKELEQFTFISSHDIKEPLLTISNYVNLLVKDYKGKLDKKADEYLSFIEDATHRSQVMANDVLRYLMAVKQKDLKSVDCNEILQKVLKNLDSLIAGRNVIIQSGPLPVIKAYPELESVFFSLIQNALKFRKKDNSELNIHISVKDMGKEWEFAVKDNGIGMDMQYKDKIFMIFQRLHQYEKFPGSGMGLALTKKIVEIHKGKIWVESEPGTGSSFYFTIPKEQASDTAYAAL